jgi:hypothetical protein
MDKQRGIVVIAGVLWICAAAITAVAALIVHEKESRVDMVSTADAPLVNSSNAVMTAKSAPGELTGQ